MELIKYKLGDLVIPFKEKCGITNLKDSEVSGINRDKEFFEPSHQVGQNTESYKNVPPHYFACNLMHVGRDVVLPIAYNHTEYIKHVSPAYSVFSIRKDIEVLDEYFFIYLKSNERDRYFWFHTDASIRDGMTWEDFCDIDITLPDLPTQEKYVEIYKSLVENQKSYERGLDDLKLTCDAYLDKLETENEKVKIGNFIEQVDERNENGELKIENLRGISIEKKFIPTKADMKGVSLKPYLLVKPNYFSYVPVTSRNGEKITLALNSTDETYIVSSSYTVFHVSDESKLCPEYLMMIFTRSEFDRYARFNSWGSARETFDWSEMCDVKIPVPSIEIQKSIAAIYNTYNERKAINEKLKLQIKDICPILIKGSLEEAKEA